MYENFWDIKNWLHGSVSIGKNWSQPNPSRIDIRSGYRIEYHQFLETNRGPVASSIMSSTRSTPSDLKKNVALGRNIVREDGFPKAGESLDNSDDQCASSNEIVTAGGIGDQPGHTVAAQAGVSPAGGGTAMADQASVAAPADSYTGATRAGASPAGGGTTLLRNVTGITLDTNEVCALPPSEPIASHPIICYVNYLLLIRGNVFKEENAGHSLVCLTLFDKIRILRLSPP